MLGITVSGINIVGIAGLASGWMLLWSAAAAIPIVLHLLNRRKQQTVSWAAMRLLLQAIEKQSRRVRFEQLVLLALRTLILLTLAFALARPFFTPDAAGGTLATQRVPRLWILAIDNSYSMGYRQDKGTRFTNAQARATQIVREAVRGDAFALLTLSQPSRPIIFRPSFDRESTLNAIQKLEQLDGGAELDTAFNHIKEIIAEAAKDPSMPTSVAITFLSDLGRDTWQDSVGSGRLSKPLRDLADRYSVSIESYAGEALPNVAVTALTPATTRGLKDQVIEVGVTVANFGSANVAQLPVQLQVEGQTVASQLVDLPAGGTQSLQMQVLPRTNGLLSLAAVVREDRLPADDQRHAVIEIRDVYRVLCIENSFSDPRILKAALQPLVTSSSPLEVTSVSPLDVSTLELELYDVVVLNDLPGFSATDFQRLRTFVDGGGAVVAMFGEHTVAENWNVLLQEEGDLFGFHLTEPSVVDDWRIDPLDYTSPIVAPFAAYPDAGLLTTPIFRYWNVQLHAAEDNPVQTEVAFHNGSPWIVRCRRGNGMVASVLSAPQTGATKTGLQSWNAMAAWPSFVPLMQQVVKSTLSQGTASRNLFVGQPLMGVIGSRENVSQLYVIRPDGGESVTQPSEMDVAGMQPWSFAQTMHRGIYRVKIGENSQQLFAVNIQPTQSDLVSVPLAQLPQSDGTSSEPLLADPGDLAVSPSQTITRSVLSALVILLLAESVLAWHLGRRL
jgi:hypothetical protein